MRLSAALLTSMPLLGAAPIVSFEGTAALATNTVHLLLDAAYFAHDKVVEALPLEYRSAYLRSQADASAYYAKNVAPHVATASDAAQTILQPTKEVLAGVYLQLDAINHNLFDNVISDFERKYPKRTGLIGSSVADRGIFVLWVYVLLNFVKTALFGRRKRSALKHCC
jgi:hypothetical protein